MTKWKGRAASIAPALLSVSVIALGTGLADAQTVISTELTTPQTIDVDEDVTVTSTGSVRLVGEDSEEAIDIDVEDYTSDVLIDGSLLYLGGSASDSAIGLRLQGDLSGTVTNNGLINVDVADDDEYVYVYGIQVEGDVSGTITNAGTIRVDGSATDPTAEGIGIVVEGELSGTIRNSGLIEVSISSVTEDADAWGIYVHEVSSTALIENNDTISAQAFTFTESESDSDSEASAYGIEVDSDLVAGARIINNGVIEAEAESNSSDAYAFGISVNGDVEGDITNTGTISALAMGGDPADTQGAYGVFVDGLVSGTVVNTGTIKADVETFDDNDYVEVFGIYVAGVEPEDESRVSLTSTGRIDNSGTIEISVDVEGLTDTSTIAGIYADGDMDGVIVNSGSIFVTADVRDISESPLFVHGIGVAGALNGTLTNSGDIVINVSAENAATTIAVFGLGVEDEVSGAIVNSGTIGVNLTVTASETATYVDVFGIDAGDIESGGSISNSGTISASLDVFASSLSASASASGTATGILVGDVDGVVSNTGSISAIASVNGSATEGLFAYAYGIDAEQVDGSIISSGSITASATASGTATNDFIYASASGLDLSDVTGTVANSGAINATAMVSGFSLRGLSASAYGIELDNLSVGAVVSNTGTIEVMASVDGSGIATSETRATLSASAYGIEMGAVNGQVYNSGSIDAQASVTGWAKNDISGFVYGIDTNSIAEGAILQNDGSVSASVMIDGWATDDEIYASAWGLEIGTVNGTVVNNGSIDVSASVAGTGSTGMGVWAYGIEMSAINATGALSNSGSIAVEAMAQGYAETGTINAYAGGIVTGSSIDGTLMTSGSVDVTVMVDATASTGIYGYAEGISVNQVNSGSVLSNSGTISATAQVEGILTTEFQSDDEQNPSPVVRGWPGIYGTAVGLALYSVEGEVNNTETISATAQTSGLIAADLDGELDFEGLDEEDRAFIAFIAPFFLQEGLGSSASIPALYATAVGVSVGDVEGELLNSGTIMASASAEGTAPFVIAEAVGLAMNDVGIDGIVDNSGSILADATAAAGSSAVLLLANAGGMDLDVVDGTVTNSGQIEVTSSTSNEENSIVGGRADARGVTVNTVSGTGLVTNTGTISATVSDSDLFAGFLDDEGIFFGPTSDFGFILPGATGLAINTLDGELFNNGAIVTDYNGDVGLAVYVGGGTGSAEFETSSFFAGHLVLGNEQLTVTSVENSNSIYWTFDEIPATVILDDSDGPQLYRSEDGSVVATVANAGAAIPGQVAADVAGLGFGSVAALLSGAPAPGAIVSRSVTETSRLSTGGVVREAPASAPAASPMGSRGMVFVQGDYVSRTVEDDQNRDLDYDISGLTAGYINRLDNGIGYGVSLSGVRADGTVDTTLGEEGVDSTGVVLGLYGNTALGGGAALTFGASFGRLSNEGTRLVNDNLAPGGVAEIEGDYDSSFISPAVELSYAMQSGNMLIRPYAGYRYTRLNVDGYTESGGTGAVTYDDRDIDVSDFTIGVDASTQAGSGVLTGSLEVLHREVSDDGANVNLFGTDGTIASAATDFTAVELGLGYGIELGTGGIDVKASGLFGNEGVSGYGVSVGYRVSF